MGTYPDNSDHAGFYNPKDIPMVPTPDYNDFTNRTNGILDLHTLRAIQNILDEAPGLHAENLNLAGEEVIWLPRLTSGMLCPNFAPNQQQCGQAKCNICFSTNYVGGFGPPRRLKMSFQPGRQDIIETPEGMQESQNPTAWTIATYPILKEFDLVITYSNERFLIASNDIQEKRGRKVYQNLTMVRPDSFSVWYSVPVAGFYASNSNDFQCSITINPIGTNFPCTITIVNPYW